MSLLSVVGCQSVSIGNRKSCRLLPGVRTGQDDCAPADGGWQSASDSTGAGPVYPGELS
jgi:hypothetical protein